MSYLCPVCGFPELDAPPLAPSFEICPSCGFQFGITDDDEGYTFEQWRDKWIAEGMLFDEGHSAPPKNWDPKKQLENLKK